MRKKPNSETRIESFKNRNGCDGRISEKPRQTEYGINFHDCYCCHLDYGFHFLLSMVDRYNKGFLPYAGSAQEQPNKIIEVINLISNLKQDLESKEKSHG